MSDPDYSIVTVSAFSVAHFAWSYASGHTRDLLDDLPDPRHMRTALAAAAGAQFACLTEDGGLVFRVPPPSTTSPTPLMAALIAHGAQIRQPL